MTRDIKDLDPNMGTKDASSNLLWHDALHLTIEGQCWKDTEDPFDRLPKSAKNVVRPPVWDLSKKSAGIAVRFISNTTSISAKWDTGRDWKMKHITSNGANGIDLYVKFENEWRWLAVGSTADEGDSHSRELMTNLEPEFREYMLYLPLYNNCFQLKIGITPNATMRPAPVRDEGYLLFYGTSIVQGGCASRAGLAHPSIIGRKLNRPIVNLGFSGNGIMEPEIADLLSQTNPAIYILDCLPNMEEPRITERVEPFIQTIRNKRPNIPILLIDNIRYAGSHLFKARLDRYLSSNKAQYAAFERLQKSGYKKLYYLKDDGLIGNDFEGTVDGTHPNDLGFMRMAEKISEKLKLILLNEKI